MRRRQFTVTVLLIAMSELLAGAQMQTDIHIIVHPDNTINRLSKKQVIDLFMGRVTVFPNQQAVIPLDLQPGDPLRARFYLALTGKTEAQVDAYWATLIFAGRMSPPERLENQQQILSTVQHNRSAIAYIEASTLPTNVKSIMVLP